MPDSHSSTVLAAASTESTTSGRRTRRPYIGEAIKNKYANGKWHRPETIAEKLAVDVAHVRETLDGMVKNQTYGVTAERKYVGTAREYRIFKAHKTVSLEELVEKLTPIVNGLEEQGRKNSVTVSLPTIMVLTTALRKLLREWAE